jgi:hypothetical protein
MRTVTVADSFQKDYTYELSAPEGADFDPEFTPDLTPKEMLALGVFDGDYFAREYAELPADWLEGAKLTQGSPDPALNYFKIHASQPLSVWLEKDWINPVDPRGWFQWYCRYYLGRRLGQEDQRQIKRWKAMRRHISQIKMNCAPGDTKCRPRQRQALLHWAYDTRKI